MSVGALLDRDVFLIVVWFILLFGTSANKGRCALLLTLLKIAALLYRFHCEKGSLRAFTPAVRCVPAIHQLAGSRVCWYSAFLNFWSLFSFDVPSQQRLGLLEIIIGLSTGSYYRDHVFRYLLRWKRVEFDIDKSQHQVSDFGDSEGEVREIWAEETSQFFIVEIGMERLVHLLLRLFINQIITPSDSCNHASKFIVGSRGTVK